MSDCLNCEELSIENTKLRAENAKLRSLIRDVAIPDLQKAYVNSDALAQLQEAVK